MAEPAPSSRTPIWEGSPSQWLILKHWLISVVAIALIVWGLIESGVLAGGLEAVGIEPGRAADIVQWILLGLLALVVANLAIRVLVVRSLRYRLFDGALQVESGLLSKRTDMLELFRVRDIVQERPFIMRLAGLGNLVLVSTDASTPRVVIGAIRRSDELVHTLREQVNQARGRVRVLEAEGDLGR